MLIGLTGRIASGKGVVADYLKKKGFIYTSLSDAVREEAKRRGIEEKRENLQDLGNLLRVQEGAGIWARKIAEDISPSGDYVIDGIRNPAEIEELRKLKDFYLISVDANQEKRCRRALERAKPSDPKTREGFLEMDARDFGEEDPSGQQVRKCMDLADYHLENNFTLEALERQIDKIYSEMRC